jgi:hypothetical protein
MQCALFDVCAHAPVIVYVNIDVKDSDGEPSPPMLHTLRHRDDFPVLLNALRLRGDGKYVVIKAPVWDA